jgi:hypothetical protein
MSVAGAKNRGGYLALKFVVSGNTYYGWGHIKLGGSAPTIIGYAYENTPGKRYRERKGEWRRCKV